MQKGQTAVLVVLGILILGIVAGGAYYLGRSQVSKPQPQTPVVTSQPTFSPAPSVDETADCKVTGCSGQVCADEDVMTTCEYAEEYGCYKNAKCERQADGQCGWTQTEQLTKCLQEKGKSE